MRIATTENCKFKECVRFFFIGVNFRHVACGTKQIVPQYDEKEMEAGKN